MGTGGEGREGDWDCNACSNRNYAFRSFCNRCKQLRLLVDTNTPADSKWLPRIGDWVCTGCTNNNYASREECKKCGRRKEEASLPATALPESLPINPTHISKGKAGVEPNQGKGILGNGALMHMSSKGSSIVTDLKTSSNTKGCGNGDWTCTCGFHNCSSCEQCKICNASIPPVHGTKRLATEEFGNGQENKRRKAGQMRGLQYVYPALEEGYVLSEDQSLIAYPSPPPRPNESLAPPSGLVEDVQVPPSVTIPTIFGKGAKQWREGDWMCVSCNNHNYSSRSKCNRCKIKKEAPTSQPISVS
ncbi:calpain-15-like [Impatiens glandulifera]|uniref:calpain-15-like n=1 Tax=Impatiens glandulifera TaxID=253017 RepID=UPI001FB10B7C|nr:calpain-15-like [Impatiens glandulifera]